MKLRDEPTIERLRPPSVEFDVEATEPDQAIWQPTEGNDVPIEADAPSKPVLTDLDSETDRLVVQYFGDVRQFALLTRAEANALWQRIEHLKKRVRRALYTTEPWKSLTPVEGSNSLPMRTGGCDRRLVEP